MITSAGEICACSYIRMILKVNVWLEIMNVHLIGPYFFVDNVNGQNYLRLLENFVMPQLNNIGMPAYFQQGGTPPHFALIVRY